MMLEHWGLMKEAGTIKEAINQTLYKGVVTEDLNPDTAHTTTEVGDYLVEKILKY